MQARFTIPLFAWFSASVAFAASPIPLTPGLNAGSFQLSPDGTRVVFESYDGVNTVLYSARTDGGGTALLSLPGSYTNLYNGVISPDSSRIVFNSSEYPAGLWHVSTYSSRLDGAGGPTLLNSSKIYDDDPSAYSLAISPDSQRAVIRADQGDFDFDLLSRPLSASSPAIALNEGVRTGNFGAGVAYNWITAGNRVVFSAPQDGDGPSHLYSRPIDASSPTVQLSPDGQTFTDYIVSGNNQSIALTTTTGSTRNLYIRPAAAGPLTLLHSEAAAPQSLSGLWIDPAGQHVVYSDNYHLFTVPANASAAAKSFGPYPDGDGTVNRIALSPDGSHVAYLSHPANGTPLELFISPIDAGSAPKKLSLPLPPGGSINSFQFTPDGRHILYFGDQLTDNVDDIFSVRTDGTAGPIYLGPLTALKVTHDGQGVIFATGETLHRTALSFIPIEGGEAPQIANNPFFTGGITQWALTSDDSALIFTADDGAGTSQLFAVAIPEPAALVSLAGVLFLLFNRRSRIENRDFRRPL